MKKILTHLFLLLVTFNLASCSTNTKEENTVAGVVAGGVLGGVAGGLIGSGGGAIALGAVIGGVVGGLIGHSMDSRDNATMNNAMNNNPTNKSTTWKNQKTHARYTVTPTSNKMAINGNPNCRTYSAIATMNGKTEKSNGTACLQKDGTWQAVKA